MADVSTLRWLITGGSSGFGRTIAETVLARGDAAVVTARDPSRLDDLAERGTETAALDVTQPDQVRSVVESVAARGPIDVLVNSAGFGHIGALEEVAEPDLRRVLETNVFGAIAMTRAVLPHMRAARSGHIVQLSSVGGVIGNPGHAAYATSKFALEGASEALAGEVAPLGIRVTIVEPGRFRTRYAGTSMTWAEPIADYAGTPAGTLREQFAQQDGNQPGDPVRAAAIIVDTVHAGAAPLRLPLGRVAVERIRERLHARLADLDAVAELAVSADYPG
ncbi:oxidoreductase [Pseudonocardia sp. CA-107938]|uniref:oxidoreductase n=1 Tax=Pseudonocardia sp. CA-107938 TaxID=3240021 RepID=UPI003D8DBFFF